MGTKRKRLALSCVDCRRRKVKCDRTYPVCVRCQKGGNADNCAYVPYTGQEPGLPTPSEEGPEYNQGSQPQVATTGEPYVLAALREMSPHLEVSGHPSSKATRPEQAGNTEKSHAPTRPSAHLETYPKATHFQPAPGSQHAGLDDVIGSGYHGKRNYTSDFGKVMVRGSSFSTHYYGPSFSIGMLLQFEELSKFVKGMLTEVSSLQSVKERMATTRAAAKVVQQQATSLQDNLASMIPERPIADKLVNQYLDTLEMTYRILHVPTFLRDYQAHWQNPEGSKTEFIVHLMLVMAAVYCIAPGGPSGFVGKSSARREVATRWIAACEKWLDEQSQKHITLAHFQAHVLIFIARGILCIKIKREWATSGHLLRLAMSVGMHREPSLLSRKISVFDQEMRRRLWFTIVEFDLIATIFRGMPPTIDSFGWDCVAPRNIDDYEFDQNSEQLPPSKSRSVFTRTSFLHCAVESLPLRIEVLSRINSVRLGLDIDVVMQYDGRLRGIIDDLPSWKDEKSVSFPRYNLLLMLYEFVLILHIPFASQATNKARFFYSVASKRDISIKTLQVYTEVPYLERVTLSNIRSDFTRASLALAHDMVMSFKKDVIPNPEQTLTLVENVVNFLGDRFAALGQGFHAYWITLSAWSLLRSKFSQTQPLQSFAQDAADRVEQLYQKILNAQVPLPLPDGTEQPSENPAPAAATAPTEQAFQNFETAFPEINQMNFFDDPFSSMNFDLSTVWDLDGYADFPMS